MISFAPFYNYLKSHGITKYQLIQNGTITSVHITRLSTQHNFTLKFINNLCQSLGCQPSDLIEYIPDEEYKIPTPHKKSANHLPHS